MQLESQCNLFVLLRSTGFIIEGFPQTSDELRFLCSKGFYPDVVVILQVCDNNVAFSTLPCEFYG